jgi:hypothetical protein
MLDFNFKVRNFGILFLLVSPEIFETALLRLFIRGLLAYYLVFVLYVKLSLTTLWILSKHFLQNN